MIFYCYYYSLVFVCSHVAAFLFKLQACVQMQLKKIACTNKSCQWKKSWHRAELAQLGEISFKIPKKDNVVPNLNSASYKVENLTRFSSLALANTSNDS